jgi:hypothetical protein
VHVDPIKPTFKALGSQRLKLKYDEPLSNFIFKFNLRHYIMAENPELLRANGAAAAAAVGSLKVCDPRPGCTAPGEHPPLPVLATRPTVGQCRLHR